MTESNLRCKNGHTMGVDSHRTKDGHCHACELKRMRDRRAKLGKALVSIANHEQYVRRKIAGVA